MILTNNGKSNSVRLDAERQRIFEQTLATLNPEERAVLAMMLEEEACGQSSLYDAFCEEHFEHQPVTMRQFLEDDYYMGLSASTLYPKLREDLIEFDETGPYSEVILGGAIGVGKTTLGSFLACRMIYLVSCLREPQRAYGLSPGSEVHFAVISKNLTLARTVLLSAVMEKIKLSPYFQEHFRPNEKAENVKFPKGIVLQLGSVYSERILGLNLFGFLLDEANFMAGKQEVIKAGAGSRRTMANYDPAEKVYATLDRRIKSRFMEGGRVPCLSVLMSSKTTRSSFLERRIAAAREDNSIFVREHAPWDVKPGSFGKDRFRILVGSLTARTRILSDEEQVSQRFLDENNSYIIDVPEEYRPDFERDLPRAVQDIAGASTDAMHSFITRQETVYAAIDEDLSHPFTALEWEFGSEGDFVWAKLAEQGQRKLRGGYVEVFWKPKRNPEAPRHVHVDTSINGDSTGIAMGHIPGWVEVVRMSPDGEQYAEIAPSFEVDFMLKVRPPPGEDIFLPEIRRLVYELIDHGFQVASFSCDSYQSAEMIQQIRARGIKAEVISVDRTNEAYDALKSALYEGRFTMYHYEPVIQELLALERTSSGKIDHPLAGSKDVSDALAGMCVGLTRLSKTVPIPFSVGYTQEADRDRDGSWILNGAKPVTPANRPDPAANKRTSVVTSSEPELPPFLSG